MAIEYSASGTAPRAVPAPTMMNENSPI